MLWLLPLWESVVDVTLALWQNSFSVTEASLGPRTMFSLHVNTSHYMRHMILGLSDVARVAWMVHPKQRAILPQAVTGPALRSTEGTCRSLPTGEALAATIGPSLAHT